MTETIEPTRGAMWALAHPDQAPSLGALTRRPVHGVTACPPPGDSRGALRIGGNAVWSEYFSGLIDEVRIYNRALTAGEIGQDMATPVNPERS